MKSAKNGKPPFPLLTVEQLLWAVFGSLGGFWTVCGLWELLCFRVSALHRQHDPYIMPFLREHYPDFLVYTQRMPYRHSFAFFDKGYGNSFMYPAPIGLFYGFFYSLFPGHNLYIFLGFIVFSMVLAGVLFGKVLYKRGVGGLTAYGAPLAIVAAAFPVWFEFKQANMEIVIWILVTTGVVLFLAGYGYGAATCFGIAASAKLYPVAYLGLLLRRRQYREVGLGLCIIVATSIAGLRYLTPSYHVSWQGVNAGINEFRVLYMLHRRVEMPFDHSLLTLVKIWYSTFPAPERFATVLSSYLAVVALIGTGLFFLCAWRMPTTNQIIFLTTACILFPPVSFEYTLLHVLVPLGLLLLIAIEAIQKGYAPPGLWEALLCSVILLAPLSEVIVKGVQFGGQIKAVVLVILMVIAVTRPFALTSSKYLAVRSGKWRLVDDDA